MRVLDRSERIRQFVDRALLALLQRRAAPFAFGLPLALVTLVVPEWNPATGIPTPDKSLLPELIPMVGFGTAFVVGWLCQRSMSTLTAMSERSTSSLWMALAGLAITSAFGVAIGKGLLGPWLALGRCGAALAVALTLWYFNLFLIGFALKRFSAPSSLRRYWADSSYWLYIAHLPLVTALQVVAFQLDWNWSIELALILVVTVSLLLLSYRFFVRTTWLGAILNGARRPQRGLEPSVVKATA